MRRTLLLVTALVFAACSSEPAASNGFDVVRGGTGPDGGNAAADAGGATADSDGGTLHVGDADASGGGVDAGAMGSDAGSSSCLAAVAPEVLGKHNGGTDCMQSKCHDGSNGAPHWTVAGTLYNAANGVIPAIGATIEVTDAKGKVVRLATSFDGNFHTTEALTFPLSLRATSCPNDLHMVAKMTSMQGCNQAGCHDSGMRLHLP